ncbi:MAG: hypothetical protein ACON4O_01640 [Lentimonas sp.]
MKKTLSTIAALLTVHQIASAHPSGHNEGLLETVLHFFSQPDHIFETLAGPLFIAVIIGAVVSIVRKS